MYAKNLVKGQKKGNFVSSAPRVIVVGGAGSGKSTVIHVLTQWVHKTLRKSGDDPQCPYILNTATTGAASVIIEGMTIHAAVGFQHGNKHHSLSDKRREIKRDQFKNVKFLIVDEISMLTSDQLYKLDLRLRELKQNNQVFGGVAIFLFGDPAQLPPVRGRAVYEKPVSDEYQLVYGDGTDSLWKSFSVVFLEENHRQGSDKTYANMLNRIRIGEQTGEDKEFLLTRVRPKDHPDLKNALYIVCERAEAYEHNIRFLNNLIGELSEVKAKTICTMRKNYKPWLKADGTIQDTNFADNLQVKIGSRVMLIHNVDVSDLLCNGALGFLIGIEKSRDKSVEKLIVKFDNPKAGKRRRNNHPNYAKKYPEGTVITKMEKEYTISVNANANGASTAKLIQFPLVLSFAVTVHKIQGQTIDRPSKIVADLRKVRNGGQAYVAMSRIKELGQLFILSELPEKKLYPNRKALDEITILQTKSINKNPSIWDKDFRSDVTKVGFLNTQSLVNKFNNIKSDLSLQQSDVMILAETWIPEILENSTNFALGSYALHLNSHGRGKGLAVFYKEEFGCIFDINQEKLNLTKISSKEMDIIGIYQSRDCSLDSTIESLEKLINWEKTTLVIGDFNICNHKNPENRVKTYLTERKFELLISTATHIEGGFIDHAYALNIGNYVEKPVVEIIPKYYSDHEAICISWRKRITE